MSVVRIKGDNACKAPGSSESSIIVSYELHHNSLKLYNPLLQLRQLGRQITLKANGIQNQIPGQFSRGRADL